MMQKFGWLHLTDLHKGLSQDRWLWPNIQDAFFKDLVALHAKTGPWHVVFFTGDLVNKGHVKEFAALQQLLNKLWVKFAELGDNPILLAVPGNHDLARPNSGSPELHALSQWVSGGQIRESFWSDISGRRGAKYKKFIESVFSNYTKWWKSHPFGVPGNLKYGLLPGDFSATLSAGQFQVGIVGLNTTFLQLAAGDYEKKLSVDSRQLANICGGDPVEWLAKHDFCVLLTHQPPEWLSHDALKQLNGEIAVPGRFAIHLYGHMHETRLSQLSIGGAAQWRRWQGASLFGLESWGNNTEPSRLHGYSAGTIEVRNGRGWMRLWPRKAIRHAGDGYWRIIPDNENFELTDGDSTNSEIVDIRGLTQTYAKTEAKTPGVGFHILLLSTDPDLLTARTSVATYLERAMGVRVTSTSSGVGLDILKFDYVILLQGWWWDNGSAALWWKDAQNERKWLFISDEDSNWPPRKLAEQAAQDQVKSFRNSVRGKTTFSDPAELPEQVGKKIGEVLEGFLSERGQAIQGLRGWERAYLAMSLPAWQAGRTAAGRPYLVSAEERTELYQQDLYVPLDGISARWYLDDDGSPNLIPERVEERAEITLKYSHQRVSLGIWASTNRVKRIALVGTPGGGKTVFLTRIAASLASACLGRVGLLESGMDLSSLRSPAGLLPIPLVIEATRIAKSHLTGLRDLLLVIADEVANTGTAAPDVGELEQGMRENRYLLLIDALDEIPDPARRSKVLYLLKGMVAPERNPDMRVVLTTRSARYTGDLAFGPEFEVVNLALLSDEQTTQFCSNWCRHRKRNEAYLADLQSTIGELNERTAADQGDESLTTNPLMLTAICMVYERYRTLPEDRGKLCSLLVDDLCRSRRSEDHENEWRLTESGKRDLLQRIALAMQGEGAQAWPVTQAKQLAVAGVPQSEVQRETRAERHLHWAADHTGLLRFVQTENGVEEVRFWHRLFREYLAASRLAQEDVTATELMSNLDKDGRLTDPFWQDVICLLPSALGTREKAGRVLDHLLILADRNHAAQGRILGLAIGAIIESRDLFPAVDLPALIQKVSQSYKQNGELWPFRDRVFLLEGFGRLDPALGDPRLEENHWVTLPVSSVQTPRTSERMGRRPDSENTSRTNVVSAFEIAASPVTVQEYRSFVDSEDWNAKAYWTHCPPEECHTIKDALPAIWRQALRHPNRPILNVTWYECIAYCRWLSTHSGTAHDIRLPTYLEYLAAIHRFPCSFSTASGPDMPFFSIPICPVGSLHVQHPYPKFEAPYGVFEWGIPGLTFSPEKIDYTRPIVNRHDFVAFRVSITNLTESSDEWMIDTSGVPDPNFRFNRLGFRLARSIL